MQAIGDGPQPDSLFGRPVAPGYRGGYFSSARYHDTLSFRLD